MMNRKTYRRHGGFTLAETMMTMLILVMVGAILVAGVPTAVHAYQRVVDAANAQLLLSTTVSRLEEELSTAVEVWTESETSQKVTAYSHYQNGYKLALFNGGQTTPDAADGGEGGAAAGGTTTPGSAAEEKGLYLVYLQRYQKGANDSTEYMSGYDDQKIWIPTEPSMLVTGQTANKNFYVKIEDEGGLPKIYFDKDNNTFTVYGLEVLKIEGDVSVVKLDEPLVIRTVKTPVCPPLDYD